MANLNEILKESRQLLETKGLDEWDKSSVEKFGKTIGKSPDEEGYFDACVLRMGKHMSDENAKGFCAKTLDIYKGDTDWRGDHNAKK